MTADDLLGRLQASIAEATAARRARYEVTACSRRPSESDADRVETAARVLHDRRHRFGTAPTCGACRDDAAAVAAVLSGEGSVVIADEWGPVFAANMQDDAFREAFHKAEREYDDAHCSCGGTRWTDDANWEPQFRGDRRQPGGPGRLPCGFCNHGGWHVPDPATTSETGETR